MQEQRYTLPPEDNAYTYYRAVLAIEPDNSHALAGLAEISQKYWRMARRLLDRNALDAAGRITKRALRVDANNQRLLDLADEIELTRRAEIAAAEAIPPEPLLTQIEAASLEKSDQDERRRSTVEAPDSGFFIH
jgi:hypothetical protein